MTIVLTKPIRVGGVELAAGTTQTFDNAKESEFVNRGVATWLVNPNQGGDVPVIAKRNQISRGVEKFSLVESNALAFVQSRGKKAPQIVFGGPEMSLSDVSLTSGTATLSIETRNGQPCLKLEIPSQASIQLSFPSAYGCPFAGDLYIQMEGGYETGLQKIWAYNAPGATIATNYTFQGAADFAAVGAQSYFQQGGPFTWVSGKKSIAVTGAITYPFISNANRLTLFPVSGQAATVYIYAIGYGMPRKGRVVVMADDGIPSWLKVGAPLFNSLGIPTTSMIIGSGAGGIYASVDVLKAYIDGGNAIGAHGPEVGSYAGNLFTEFYTNAARLADMERSRDWFISRGLYTPGAERIYAWPQGVFQSAAGDTSMLDSAYGAGFRLCRCSSLINAARQFVTEAASKYNLLALPYTTHGWAGTTAGQVALITAVTDAIAAAAASGSDVFLTFHKIVPDSTADGAMDSVSCRISDMLTIANAIKARLDDGTMEAITFPELALRVEQGSYWSRI